MRKRSRISDRKVGRIALAGVPLTVVIAACGSSGPSAAQQYQQAATKANAALAAAGPGLDKLTDSSTADQIDSAFEPIGEAMRILDEAVRRIHFDGTAATDAKALLVADGKVEADIGSISASYAADPTAVTKDLTSASGAADQLRADLGLPPAPAPLASTSASPTPTEAPESSAPSNESTAPASDAAQTAIGINQRATQAEQRGYRTLNSSNPDPTVLTDAANSLDGVEDSIQEYLPGGAVPLFTGKAATDASAWSAAVVKAAGELKSAAAGGFVPDALNDLPLVVAAGNQVVTDLSTAASSQPSPAASTTESASAGAAPALPSGSTPAPWGTKAVNPPSALAEVASSWAKRDQATYPCELYTPTSLGNITTEALGNFLEGSAGPASQVYQIDWGPVTLTVWPPVSSGGLANEFAKTDAWTYTDGTQVHSAVDPSSQYYNDVLFAIPGQKCFYELQAADHADWGNALSSMRRLSTQ